MLSQTTTRIPVCKPYVYKDTLQHIEEALAEGWLGQGNFTSEFETRIEEYIGRPALATNTGTSALHLGLLAAGVGPGDEVITPSWNYVADHQAILMTGADVVMCDITEDLVMDVEKVEALINYRTKALLPLHFAGVPCDLDGVYDLARRYDIKVVEDCCHAFGSNYKDRKIGSFGDIACFSFDPVKVLTSVDGGAVVPDTFDDLRKWRFLGVEQDTHERIQQGRPWEYDVMLHGFRYHMNDVLASVGIAQIKHIDELIESRQVVCKLYDDAFGELALTRDFDDVSPFIYVIKVDDRDSLVAHLDKLDISVGVHFPPVHRHTFFKRCRKGDMTVTDRLCQKVLSLPLHSHMEPESVERVIEGVTSWRS
jgi:dTDP-4-amino-4,6-dideoxygalactose transaminase